MLRNKNGITLIALVVTIVVLLILAGVSINLVLDNNGIIEKSKDAKIRTRASQVEDEIGLWKQSNFIKKESNQAQESADTVLASLISRKLLTEDEIDREQELITIKKKDGSIVKEISYMLTPKEGVAMLDNVVYATLQNAVDKVLENNQEKTIFLLKDISENVYISSNKNIVLNLENHNISNNLNNKPIMDVEGKITVNNGNITGENLNGNPVFKVNKDAELNIVSANIEGNNCNWETVELYGILNIESGKISSEKSNVICTYNGYGASIKMSDNVEIIGANTAYSAVSLASGNNMTIEGGKINSQNSNAISNGGKLVINGGTITGIERSVIVNSGTFIMNGGNIEFNSNTGNGTAGTYINAIYNTGNIEINSGIIMSNKEAISIKSGTVNVNGGKIEGKSETIEMYGGTLNINGGHIISSVYSGYGSTALYSYSSVINFYNGTIETINQLYIGKKAIFNHYGGEIIKSSSIGTVFSVDGTYNDYREN